MVFLLVEVKNFNREDRRKSPKNFSYTPRGFFLASATSGCRQFVESKITHSDMQNHIPPFPLFLTPSIFISVLWIQITWRIKYYHCLGIIRDGGKNKVMSWDGEGGGSGRGFTGLKEEKQFNHRRFLFFIFFLSFPKDIFPFFINTYKFLLSRYKGRL